MGGLKCCRGSLDFVQCFTRLTPHVRLVFSVYAFVCVCLCAQSCRKKLDMTEHTYTHTYKRKEKISSEHEVSISHPSTNQARPCLASEIRRDRARSGWYGRRRGVNLLNRWADPVGPFQCSFS